MKRAIFLTILLAAVPCSAAVITVAPDGSGDEPTIQDAVDVALDGDVVQVEDGTYTGDGNRDIDFMGKAITVHGNVSDPNLVVIDCQGTETEPHRGFKFISGEDPNSVLEGLTITNGYGPLEDFGFVISVGGGIYCEATSPKIRKCIFVGNSASRHGGGIYGCNGTITDCIFSSNSASNGGGFYYCNGTIENCTVSGNSADSGGGFDNCDGTIENCTVSGNTADYGGGFYDCDGTIENCIVTGNTVGDYGGGFSYCDGTITNCTVSGNFAGDYGGGFIACDGTIKNCTVSGNSADICGGGFHYCHGTITNCTVSGNFAGDYGGGFSACDGTIESCTVIGNSANLYGGGFYRCDGMINNCTVSGNSAAAGGGFYDCERRIENCIVWANTADEYDQIYTFVAPAYCCIQGWTDGTYGNIDDDPLFVDAANDDYHLSSDSPCINAGDPSIVYDPNETDIDGNPRVVFRLDMGADEFFVSNSAVLFVFLNNVEFVTQGIDSNIPARAIEITNYGAHDLNWQLISDCNWLSITPEFGQIESLQTNEITIGINNDYISYGLQSCQFQIIDPWAVNSPQIVTVTLNVLGPKISAVPGNLIFEKKKDGANPDSQILSIANSGYDTLYWELDLPADCNWLSVNPTSGQSTGEVDEVILSVDTSRMEHGIYDCNLTVSDPNAENSPQIVPVSLRILAEKRYVDGEAAGNCNGSSWTDAYNNLHDALVTTAYGGQIFVADGTYKPTVKVGGTGDRYKTFQLKNGVTVKGGFAGWGADDPNERNIELYETIFSGDIGVPIDPNDNCYHVFYHPAGTNLDPNAVLDGVTITAGNADLFIPLGEGHYNGGGMHNYASSPTITNCTFTGNMSTAIGYGQLINGGGGMYNYYSSPEVTNCTFSGNTAFGLWLKGEDGGAGGGMFNVEYSSPEVTHCTFSGNTAVFGAGMENYSSSSPTVTNCTFSGNSADWGGGMENWSNSSPMVTNCAFTGNSADWGGGMDNWDNSSPMVTNCILWANSATDTGDEIYNNSSYPNFMYCDISGSGGSTAWDSLFGTDGGGNIDTDPEFANPNGPDGIIGTEDDNLRLSPGSPCIDAGDNTAPAEPTDLDGHTRIVDGDCDSTATVDMGAYEFDWLYIGDLAGGCDVDLEDFAVLAGSFGHDNPAIDIAPYPVPDGIIDFKELLILAEYWLEGTE